MRLHHVVDRAAGEPFHFTFDARPIEAWPGETVAAALAAAGIVELRRTRTGAPRGVWCGMGACFDCLVTIDGRPSQRACLVKAAPGASVTAAGPSGVSAASRTPEVEVMSPDVLVVGAGPAGLAAAIAAREAGAAVVVLDERAEAGGQYYKPLVGKRAGRPYDRQFREGDSLRARAQAAGVVLVSGALVWGGFAADEVAAVTAEHALLFKPKRLVLAPGAHERPVPLPGWTLPGVMTTGALQTFARAQRVVPGAPVVVAGSGPLNIQLAAELVVAGVEVAAVVDAGPGPTWRRWRALGTLALTAPRLALEGLGHLLRLRLAGVPVRWRSRVVGLEGDGRVELVSVRTPADLVRLPVAVCALNEGFQPDVTLARALGAAHRFVPEGLGRLETVTDAVGRTSVAGVFAVGDGAAFAGARVALARGRLAGLAAAAELGFEAPDAGPTRRSLALAERFQRSLWRIFPPAVVDLAALGDDVLVCRCEEVTAGALRRSLAAGNASLGALKKATRAGMGRCQGRMCAATMAHLVGIEEEAGFAAPRPPLRPVPIRRIARAPAAAPQTPSLDLALPRPPAAPGAARARADVVVVGAGIIGLCAGLALARRGVEVVIVDRGDPGMAASTANAGSLHVQMHALDTTDADAAFAGGGPLAVMLGVALDGIALWRELEREAADDLGIRTEGGLMLAETRDQLDRLRAKVAVERAHGVASDLLGANELYELAPYLGSGFAGAAFCRAEGQIDPLAGTLAVRDLAQANGVRILTRTTVTGLERAGKGFSVTTDRGHIAAARVVNAAGAWAGAVARAAGVRLPVRGTVQQVLVTEPVPMRIPHLVLHAARRLSLKQGAGGHLILGGAWPGDWDPIREHAHNRRSSIEGNLRVACDAVPAIGGYHLLRAWAGLNVQIPGAPIVGEAPGAPGLFHAVTFNGYTLGPAVGRMVADAVLGRPPPVAFRPR